MTSLPSVSSPAAPSGSVLSQPIKPALIITPLSTALAGVGATG